MIVTPANPLKKLLVLILLYLFGTPLATFAEHAYHFTESTYQVTADSSKVYRLPDNFIYPQSEKVFINSHLQKRDIIYTIDYPAGIIIFNHDLPDSATILIKYSYMPLNFQLSYKHREPIPFVDSLSVVKLGTRQTIQKRKDIYSGTTLEVGGAKTIGINVASNRDMSLEQSLRVNVFGKISNDIRINAVLSDQNTPLQPEGTTEEIRELDKVFIEVVGKNFGVILGDYELDLKNAEFASYFRKLQGVKGTINYRNYTGLFAGATSKGDFRSQDFLGQDGKQGPYQLTGQYGETDIVVIGGSEKVWVNGELVKRGENNAYIIEYGNGQITFTSSQIIDSETRIIVDFEYTTQQFKRSLYVAKTGAKYMDEKLEFNTTMISESDDKDNPLDISWTKAYKEHLELTGDNPDSAWTSGGELVGENEGDYTWNGSYFEFAGRDSGNYDVKFTKVAFGSGDYSYVGGGVFQFVGMGIGDYLAQIELPLPESKLLSDFKLAYRHNQSFAMDGEVAISNWDKNTMSDRDDGDNSDWAGIGNIYFSSDTTRLGRLNLTGTYRQINKNFHSPGRIVPAEYNREWGFINGMSEQEKVYQVKGEYLPHKRLTLSTFYGKMNSDDNFFSIRNEYGVVWLPRSFPSINYRYKRVDANQDSLNYNRIFQKIHTQHKFWKLTPQFDGEYERSKFGTDENQADSLYWQGEGGISIDKLGNLSAVTSYKYRLDRRYDTALEKWQDKFITKTQKYKIALKGWHDINLSGEYNRRRKVFKDVAGLNSRNDIIEARGNHTLFDRGIYTNFYYSLNNTATRQRKETYTLVEEGFGDYSYDETTGQYYLDSEHGKYIKEVILSPDLTLVSDLKSSLSIRMDLDKVFTLGDSISPWGKFLRQFASTTEIKVAEKSTEEDVLKVALMNFRTLQQDSTTLLGQINLRQDLDILRKNTDISFRLRYEWIDVEDNQSIGIWEERKEEKRSLRIRSSYWMNTTLESNLEWSSKREDQKNDDGQSVYYADSENYIIKNKGMYKVNKKLELLVDFNYRLSQNTLPVYSFTENIMLDQYSIKPGINYFFKRDAEKTGRLSFDFTISNLTSDKNKEIIPYTLLGTERIGLTLQWQADGSYNFNKNITGNLRYSAVARPDNPIIHQGKMEIRAYF